MPYLTGYTDDVEKALFLRRWGVPHYLLRQVAMPPVNAVKDADSQDDVAPWSRG